MTAPTVSLILTIEIRSAIQNGHLSDRHAAKAINQRGPIPAGCTVRLVLGPCRTLTGSIDGMLYELAPAGRVVVDGSGTGTLELVARMQQAWA